MRGKRSAKLYDSVRNLKDLRSTEHRLRPEMVGLLGFCRVKYLLFWFSGDGHFELAGLQARLEDFLLCRGIVTSRHKHSEAILERGDLACAAFLGKSVEALRPVGIANSLLVAACLIRRV